MANPVPESKKQGLTVLRPEDRFRFDCHAGLSCFTRCCRDITIFLTPYDILRMKNALGVSSEVFLAKYTHALIGENGIPLVALKMCDDESKSCPFVTPEGCRIYSDRPWSCRIYPLQPESTEITEKAGRQYYSVMDIPFCEGFAEEKATTVRQWLEDQEVFAYMEMEQYFKKITRNKFLSDKVIANPKIQQMIYMACYDLDRFRRFVFESSFLNQFAVDPGEVEKIRTDDEALFQFAMKWLEYGLIGQQGLKLKPEVMAAKKNALGMS
ncbi:MAG TPA: YkgJ family cysteine cluster protein [Desulfosalsimonadaceae bacterium]|nr:YkgJ family cysteine cluster protein [Desulfosalsimonadaceae bacterium]